MTYADDNFNAEDKKFMRRALELATLGRGYVSPNPMVGAVIVHDGKIIGEGWHRRFGSAHAEVNAVASVLPENEHLLCRSTIYVTLEPCSHYGKTPPCALLLKEKGFRRVVAGAVDPNPKVAGRGLNILREAGIEVQSGLLADECEQLNRAFFFAHRKRRPYVTLKWAQGADGLMDGHFSSAITQNIVHLRRSTANAIIVGAGTVLADNPALNVRYFDGQSPRPIILDRHNLLANKEFKLRNNPETLIFAANESLEAIHEGLYRDYGYISVMVEGGAKVLQEFISSGLWEEAFVEESEIATGKKIKAPVIAAMPVSSETYGHNTIYRYLRESD